MKNFINDVILRQYDIRGTYPKTLDDDQAYFIGRALAAKLNPRTVVIGYDGRLSSPILCKNLLQGLWDQGVRDINCIGICPTPQLYYTSYTGKYDLAVMITGSHNPKDDNGFKIVYKNAPFFGDDILSLKNLEVKDVPTSEPIVNNIKNQNDYINRLLKDYDSSGKPLKIAFDAGNGATGDVVKALTSHPNFKDESTLLFCDIDGTFPNHHPDPTVYENLTDLLRVIQENDLDAGIAFDGDGDRIGLIDKQGRMFFGDQILMLYARALLKDHPKATIIADVKTSDAFFKEVEHLGGTPIMHKTGHSFIKLKMKETGAPLAGEMSGHVFFNDIYYGFDDGLYAAIRLLNILKNTDQTLEDLYDSLPKMVNTPEVKIPCPDLVKFEKVEQMKDLLKKDNISFNDVDGVRVQLDYGWWLLRASNTQAILVTRCEADSKENLEKVQKNLQHYLDKLLIH